MARLHEYQGKKLLAEAGIKTPKNYVVRDINEIDAAIEAVGLPAVIKAQTWTTGRAAIGAIAFADTAGEAQAAVKKMLGLEVKGFPVTEVLIEEKLKIKREFYLGTIIDDANKCPRMIFSSVGGTGIEEIAKEHPDKVAHALIDFRWGLRDFEARNTIRKTGVTGKLQVKLAGAAVKLYQTARKYEARSAEINPLVVVESGDIIAADCRFTVDDYAVFRHPDLGIEIAREFGHPPTELDKIAYDVEKNDWRGTFYFIELARGYNKGDRYLGFHGAGGGGSMMSMDALTKRGYKIANFCDTSGNPPASKVYRAARIILAQPNIDGYFGSGSGVASQEQFHSARGLVKAFREQNLSIPTVIRLGGNLEDLAIEILTNYTKDLPGPVEGYKKDDPADFCAERMQKLLAEYTPTTEKPRPRPKPSAAKPYSFQTITGTVTYDHEKCARCESKICIETCVPQILKLENGLPVLAITEEEAAKGKCTECLACEVECEQHGAAGGYVDLPIVGLDEYLEKA
jgi:succinyl-CoA synthetase beta subunit